VGHEGEHPGNLAELIKMKTIYHVFDRAGRLLYIGCSTRPLARLAEHRCKDWFCKIANVTFKHVSNHDRARRIESIAIVREHPRFNKNSGLRVRG
jgi:hypothetical protein